MTSHKNIKSQSTDRIVANRQLRFLVAIAIAATDCAERRQPAAAVSKSWTTGNGSWSTGANWSPVGAPAAGDAALIGPHAGAANSVATLNVQRYGRFSDSH